MDIKTLKDLAKLTDLCRKKGIKEVSIGSDGSMAFSLTPDAPTKVRKTKDKSDKIPTEGQPSEEDLLFWSSAGVN